MRWLGTCVRCLGACHTSKPTGALLARQDMHMHAQEPDLRQPKQDVRGGLGLAPLSKARTLPFTFWMGVVKAQHVAWLHRRHGVVRSPG